MATFEAPTADLGRIQAVILAGGKGTRLRPIVSNRPKALALIAGKPFMDWMLTSLAVAGIRRVVLCTGFLASMVREYVCDGTNWGIQVRHSEEREPLGTGGALRYALAMIDSDPVLVLNGDSWCDTNLVRFLAWHLDRQSQASVLLTWMEDCSRFGTVEVAADASVLRFTEKTGERATGWINCGMYFLQRSAIETIPADMPVSLERDVFPLLAGAGLYGYQVRGHFVDIGTPESYMKSQVLIDQLFPSVADKDDT